MQSDWAAFRARLIELYLTVRASFWFVPLICVVLALAACWATLRIDASGASRALVQWVSLPKANVDGAREILSTIAGSIITVAALVFSLTFVALTLMSQQFGPRILAVYMKDTTTQIVIGLFVGSFLYALFVLGAVGTGELDGFVPHLSLYLACLLAVLCFLAIIYFIHHIAISIQADSVVAKLGNDLDEAIEDVLLASPNTGDKSQNPKADESDARPETGLTPVSAEHSGYVQVIDYERALALMEKNGSRVWYECRPGHFVIEGLPIGYVECQGKKVDEVVADLSKSVHLGERRTQAQFAEFELNALVEVALRALSPGINDPYTAIACINHLTDALVRLARGRIRPAIWRDPDGVARVMAYPQTFAHFMDSAFHPIRHAACGNTQVIIHIVDALHMLSDGARNETQKAVIRDHAQILLKDVKARIKNEADCKRLCSSLNEVCKQTARRNATSR